MTRCEPSAFLRSAAPGLRAALDTLKGRYGYVSVLATDSSGISFSATPRERRAGDSNWSERGFVFRAQRDGKVAECAFDELPRGDVARAVGERLDALLASPARAYPALPDEEAKADRFGQVDVDPFALDAEAVLDRLDAVVKKVSSESGEIAFAQASVEFMRVRKLFMSPARELEQSFIWSQAYVVGVGKRGDVTKENYEAFSGLKGAEILDEVEAASLGFARETVELLSAGKIEPGEYEVIATPDITGLIAHEAFGHGVETDMFAKGRALAKDYLGKPVASAIVDMYDGAAEVDHCGSFLFDDEGNFARKTKIIDKGILVSGISDALSALSLGFQMTGNGRRQGFAHKAYARMTNTYIAPGTSKAEDMIASIKYGFILDKTNSGMEDPKNWGIQLVVSVAREIRDGKPTGRVFSPVVCSGYVPQVLSDISMVSGDFELRGAGYCGKGHKEYVKVSSGGPWIKTKMRLG
jgi:TldD protein